MLEQRKSGYMNMAKKLAAKGKAGFAVAMLWLSLVIFARKLYKYVKMPAFKIASCLLIGIAFLGSVSFMPVAAEDVEYDESAYQEIELEEELSAEEYIQTDVSGEEGVASLEDVIAEINSQESEESESYQVEEETTSDLSRFDKSSWNLLLVNKQHPIPEDYTFTLGTIKGVMKCDERILLPLADLLEGAKQQDINLIVCSPYRDTSRQEYLFDRKMKTYINRGYSYMDAYKEASAVVTVPGASEHQIGISLDIICDEYALLDEGFGETEAGIWLKNNSYKYGFILRYPQDKEDITGIIYEPWHYRYVGVEAATYIYENNLTLEEFIESL